MPDQAVLEDLRAQLLADRESLRSQLSELTGQSFDENFADSAQVAAEQGEARVLVASLAEQLDDVERALTKLDEGTYGRCETCGEEISQLRLEAMPSARHCIRHA